jgi:hypothetical protein
MIISFASAGRESGIWEGRTMTELSHIEQEWDTLKVRLHYTKYRPVWRVWPGFLMN